MPAPFTPVRVPRDPNECASWLYEALKRLNRHAVATSLGIAAVGRGETPDGSGGPLVPTDDYLFKPGVAGGQTAHGDTAGAGELVLVSTAHTTKGKIFLGTARSSAYNEAADFLGIGDSTPNAALHVKKSPVPTGNFGTTTTRVQGAAWLTGTAGSGDGADFNTVGQNYIDDPVGAHDSDSTFLFVNNAVSGVQEFRLSGFPANLSIGDTIHIVMRRTGSLPAGSTLSFNLTPTGSTTKYLYTFGDISTLLTTSHVEYTYTWTGAESQTSGGTSGSILVNLVVPAGFTNGFFVTQIYFGAAGGAGADAVFLAEYASSTQSVPLSLWRDSSAREWMKLGPTGTLTVGTTDTNASAIKLVLQGTASQSVDLLQVLNSSASTLVKIDSAGKLVLNIAFQFNVSAATGRILSSTDASGNAAWSAASTLATRVQFEWRANGPYRTGTEVDGQVRIPTAFTISYVRLYRKTAGSADSTTVDLNKNGTTMYTTQGNRPSVTAAGGNNQASSGTLPDVTSVAAGDVLSIDIDAVEAGMPADFVLIIEGA